MSKLTVSVETGQVQRAQGAKPLELGGAATATTVAVAVGGNSGSWSIYRQAYRLRAPFGTVRRSTFGIYGN